MTSPSEPLRVAGIVLAAGSSTRFAGDRPKQLLELKGEPFVRRVAQAALAADLHPVIVVLGHAAEDVSTTLHGLDVRQVVNPDYTQGQSTSVRAGLTQVTDGSHAAIFLPADQPLLSSTLIGRLVATYRRTGAPIVVPTHGSRRGAPVLFDHALFGELEQLKGDTGGRAVLPRYASELVEVEVDDPRELADVDNESDLQRLRR
ncbi:MAG: nucleotidyltransferase family protein, partial [Acidobacteriota bacterium]